MNIRKLIPRFERSVINDFAFLENYGYKRQELAKIDIDHYLDRKIEINYISETFCVKIYWYITDAILGVAFFYLIKGKIPQKYSFDGRAGYEMAIRLDDLVDFLSAGQEINLFPESSPHDGMRKINRIRQERIQMIDEQMEILIQKMATRVKLYGKFCLNDDISIFSKVKKYLQQKKLKTVKNGATGNG